MTAKAIPEIQKINDQYDYEDTLPHGKGDNELVSCGQCDEYNELQYIYDEKLQPFIDQRKFTKDQAISALEKTCKEIKNPHNREEFYENLSDILNVTID